MLAEDVLKKPPVVSGPAEEDPLNSTPAALAAIVAGAGIIAGVTALTFRAAGWTTTLTCPRCKSGLAKGASGLCRTCRDEAEGLLRYGSQSEPWVW